jgi:hypothetical protein
MMEAVEKQLAKLHVDKNNYYVMICQTQVVIVLNLAHISFPGGISFSTD